jgi:hypothetical protein
MEHETEGTLLMAEDDESFWEVWSAGNSFISSLKGPLRND